MFRVADFGGAVRKGRSGKVARASGQGALQSLSCGAIVIALLFGPGTDIAAAANGEGSRDARVQQAQAARTYSFDIPAQALPEALNAFRRITGWQVADPDGAAQGLSSAAVSGRYTAQEALELLLAGAEVNYDVEGKETVRLSIPSTTLAQTHGKNLDPVVVSATRTETPVSELTRPVTVVDREEIDKQKRIDRSLGDILSKTVPGFSPSTEALTDFGQTLRGRTFLTMIDGVPQSTPLRDGRRSLNTIDADAIERVEVVRGGTAAYGFGATGGLVNIITRRPEDGAINGHSEAGLKFSTTHPDDSLEWHTNHRVSGRTGKLGYEFDGGDQRIEWTANHFNIMQDTEFGGIGTGDPSRGIKTPAVRGNFNAKDPGTENTTTSLNYRNKDVLGSDVRTKFYYGDLTTRFGKFPGFPQVEVVSEKAGGRLTVDTPVELDALPFNLTWGLDYLHDETTENGVDAPSTTPNMTQDAVAGFLQAEVPVGSWGLIRSGVRHEIISVDVDDVLNRQGINVEGGRWTSTRRCSTSAASPT